MACPRGFSLPELLACLAVLGVTLGLALPSFSGMLEQARLLNSFHAMTASLASARITAVSRGVPVTVCPSADGRSCRLDLAWEQGWIVYLDAGRQPQPAAQSDVLQHVQARGPGLSIRGSSGRHRVRYQPTGLSGGNNVTLRFCSGRVPRHAGDVVVNLSGRPRTWRQPNPETPCPHAR